RGSSHGCGDGRGWCVSSTGYRPRFSAPLVALGERNRLIHLGQRCLRMVPPVARPDTVELPAQAAQDGLAQSVAVASCLGAVVIGTVALDTEQVASGCLRIDHGQINAVP